MRTLALIWVMTILIFAMTANFVRSAKTGEIGPGVVSFFLNLTVTASVIYLYATGDGS